MATRTIANGGGNYNVTGTWVEGAVPTAADNIVATATSGNLVINAAVAAHSVDLTNYVGILTCSGARTWTIGGGATTLSAAVLTLGSGMTWTGGGTFTITFDNRSGGTTVTSNGVTMRGITNFQNGANASQTTTTIADTTTLTSGAGWSGRGTLFITSGTTFTIGDIGMTGTTTKAVSFAGATIVLNAAAGFTSTGASGLTITDNSSSTMTLSGAASVFNSAQALTFTGKVEQTGSGNCTIAGTAPTFGTYNRAGTAVATDSLALSVGFTVTGTLTCVGNATNNLLTVNSDTYGTARTITVTGATVNGQQNVRFRDITMSGATASGTAIGDCGGNSGITFTGANNRYLSNMSGTGNWNDNNWASSSNGAANIANYPLPQDTAILDTHSFTSAGFQVNLNDAHLPAIDASNCTSSSHTLNAANILNGNFYYGNVAFSSNGISTWAASAGATQIMAMRSGTQTWTQNGAAQTVSGANAIQIQNISGTFQPQDDFTWGGTNGASGFSIINGTLNPLGNVTIPYITDSGTATKAFTGTSGKTVTLKTVGTLWSLQASGTTNTPNSINLAITDVTASAKTVALGIGGQTYGDVTVTTGGAGALNFQGIGPTVNSYNVTGGTTKTITFSHGATFNLSTPVFFTGKSGNLITVTSDSAGSAFTLAYTGEFPVITDFIALKDCTASGTTNFYAGNGSTNTSGNTNWTFQSAIGTSDTSTITENIPSPQQSFGVVVVPDVPAYTLNGVKVV